MKSISARIALLGGFTLLALILFLPSTPVSKLLPSFWADKVPRIVLGLDLQGGMHLVLDVDRDEAVSNYTQTMAKGMAGLFSERGLKDGVVVAKRGKDTVVITLKAGTEPGVIKALVKDEFRVFQDPKDENGKLLFKLADSEAARIRDGALEQVLEVLRNRIDEFGVAEPIIQKQGEREIVVQLAGIKDTKRALDLIGKTAVLEFRMLDEENDVSEAIKYGAPFGSELMYEKKTDPISMTVIKIPYLVKSDVLLTGDMLSDARVAFDQTMNKPYVAITFNSGGARLFERITERNVDKRMAIILDGNVYSAPVIRDRIAGGRASIEGGFTVNTARDLAVVLRAGSLSVPVEIVQNVTVGPTLGRDSIEAGLKAIVFGGVLVFVFMIIYYKFSGVIANFAVFLNIIMLLGAMAWFNATLTLPGIAGILLTIGMGVDSNVLIFERIREELKAGRTPRSAVNAGYDRAWWTIVDSNVTTLITAAVLFQFGSGPIKGFAVTLSLGILINLFTSLVGTKLLFDFQSEKMRVKKVSI